MKLILASSSPRRVYLLKQICFVPDVIHPAEINEDPLKKEDPFQYAKRLAREKAEVVSSLYPNDIVIAADTVVTISSKILGKPSDATEAREFIEKLSGRRHRVYTALCIIKGDIKSLKVCTTRIKFKRISKDELDLFINSNEWEGKAGGYMIQGIASAFVENINGSVTNVIGLPLLETNNILRSLGFAPNLYN